VPLIGAGLFLTSFARVTSIDLGFDYHDVLTMQVRPLEMASSPAEIALMTARHRAAFDAILERVRAIPGVDTAALVGQLPLRGDLVTEDVVVPGQHVPAGEDVEVNRVSPDYLRALRIPLLEGRGFTDADRQGSEAVVILNAAAARAYFPGIDPLGRVMEVGGRPWTVVGLVGDIRRDGPEAPPTRQSYRPLAQTDFSGATVVVRTSRDAAAMTPLLRNAVWSQFPDVPLLTATLLEQFLTAMLGPRRLNMWLLTVFGALGVGIAGAGIYGVTSFVVAQRTKEIGIRLALGAQPAAVWSAVVLGASRQLALGLAVGLAGAWLLGTLVQRFLFRVSAHAIGVYAVACVVLVTIGLVAAFLPARRASHLDPLRALRVE
jgi:putative ABC transport system permease protein